MDAAKTLVIRALTSLKFWTTILGLTSSWLAKKGVILDPSLADKIVYLTMALVGGQAIVGHGKDKATIEGETAVKIAQINASAPSSAAPVANQVVVVEDKADAPKVVVGEVVQ